MPTRKPFVANQSETIILWRQISFTYTEAFKYQARHAASSVFVGPRKDREGKQRRQAMMYFRVTLYLCLLFAGISIVLGQMFLHRAHDKVPCKDKSSLCEHYPKEKHCVEKSSLFRFMQKNCANYCGICNCRNWIHGCCKDRKTRADGPNEGGCSQKLCYDVKPDTCKEFRRDGKCSTDKETATKICPWACNECRRKSLAPIKSCYDIGYGCCWDGSTALGRNKRGCPPCRDFYGGHVCRQFRVRPTCYYTGAFFRRTFLINYCPRTCGICRVNQLP